MNNRRRINTERSEKSENQRKGLGFDNTANARYESMRNKLHRGHLLRRHQDLDRECERQINVYNKCMEHFSMDVDKNKTKLETRLNRLITNSTDKSKALNGVQPNLNNQGSKTVLLFSIIHKDGEEIYINRLNQTEPDITLTVPSGRGSAIEQKKDSFITERKVSASSADNRHRKSQIKRPFMIRELTM